MQRYTVYFILKLLYMIRVVPSPIIRSANNCIYSIWYLSRRYCYLPLSWECWKCSAVPTVPRYRQIAVTAWQIPDAVDTVVCAPDDGWWYHPNHVEQFQDKINCVTLHLVGHILEYTIAMPTFSLTKNASKRELWWAVYFIYLYISVHRTQRVCLNWKL